MRPGQLQGVQDTTLTTRLPIAMQKPPLIISQRLTAPQALDFTLSVCSKCTVHTKAITEQERSGCLGRPAIQPTGTQQQPWQDLLP